LAALRDLIATWLRLAIFETMNQPEGDARLWFVLDELDALGQIDGLKDALARPRKFGGRCVLGFQSGEKEVALPAGRLLVIPKGVWHTAKVTGPSRLLAITAGSGTQHRPM